MSHLLVFFKPHNKVVSKTGVLLPHFTEEETDAQGLCQGEMDKKGKKSMSLVLWSSDSQIQYSSPDLTLPPSFGFLVALPKCM